MTIKFIISDYLEKYNNYEELRKQLIIKRVYTKKYDNDNLILIYNKFNNYMNELERECRSLVIDANNFKIISYSCESPLEIKKYELADNEDVTTIINTCYEGTYLSIFNYNNKWYLSTRKHLNIEESYYYKMFNDVILSSEVKDSKVENFNDINTFFSELDPNLSYYFILIHYENKHIIDYTSLFGVNYKKLCLTSIKDANMNEVNINNHNLLKINNIFYPSEESYNNFCKLNNLSKINIEPICEGLIIKKWNTNMNKYNLYKLQYDNYKYYTAVRSEQQEINIYRGLLFLYQNNKLNEYFKLNNNYFKTIIINNYKYSTIYLLDLSLKICASELYILYKQNKIPKEYKFILYNIKNKINDITIYNCLKLLETSTLAKILKEERHYPDDIYYFVNLL
jgi:hypothetical protein